MGVVEAIDVEVITPPAGASFRLLRWKDNLREVEQLSPTGRWLRFEGAGEHWHLHRETELTFIAVGSGVRLVGDHIEKFEAPELELLGPNLPHCVQSLCESYGVSFQFHWPLDHPIRAVPELASLEPLWAKSRRGLLFDPTVAQRLGPRLLDAARVPPAARLGILLESLAVLAALPPSLCRSLSGLTFAVQEGESHQAGIERVIRRILERYFEPMPLSEALRTAGMSKANFERQFPRYAGSTYTGFINRVRLDHARRLVLGSLLPIAEIAYQVGFNHLSHFNRLYRRAYGAAPGSHRRAHPFPHG